MSLVAKNACVKEFSYYCTVVKSHTSWILGYFLHTSSFNKWTKISSVEIIIFELKNDGTKWSRIYFEIDRAPSELLQPSAKISAQNGRIGLAA